MLRLAIAQLRPRKGAYEENLGRLGAVFRELAAQAEPPDLVVAPEAALTGYFLEGGVRELAVSGDQLFHDLSCQHRDAQEDNERAARRRSTGQLGQPNDAVTCKHGE